MKTSSLLICVALASALSSCTTVVTSPVAPVAPPVAQKPKPKPKPDTRPDGALKPVPNTPKPVVKPFPEIPLKEDTGTTPLIHSKPDTPTYKRSGS